MPTNYRAFVVGLSRRPDESTVVSGGNRDSIKANKDAETK